MNPKDYLKSRKAVLDKALDGFFTDSIRDFRSSGALASDVLSRLKKFSTLGKSIRGCLCLATAEMAGKLQTSRALSAAMSVELVHSGFLVHDDIMDNDELRRGFPTVFAQYLPIAGKAGAASARDLAVGLGICAGDIAYFLAEGLLQTLPVKPDLRSKVSAFFNREVVRVGLGQMDDVWWGQVKAEPTAKDIERIYRFKTSRYTFSLPCVMGGMIAELPAKTLDKLAEAGEHMGIAFQLRDDELGLISEEADTSKPAGSDARENKKTLIRLTLLRRANPKQRKILLKLFGDPDLGRKGLGIIRELYDSTGAREEVNRSVAGHTRKAEELIRTLSAPIEYREFLLWMLRYAVERKK